MLTGVGAMRSARFAPAGLLVDCAKRVMLDGGPRSVPDGGLDAWLVTDERAELIGHIRARARERGLEPEVGAVHGPGLDIVPQPVVHTSRPTYGYLISVDHLRIAWAPEFLQFPDWANGADLMFADAAGWDRPIRFAGGVGGHAAAEQVAVEAQHRGVRRLVFAHIGRPTIRAMDAGRLPAFGTFGHDGQVFHPRRWRG